MVSLLSNLYKAAAAQNTHLCKYRKYLCISDSEEIDPVYFEKVNLVGRLGTFPADGTISKQETLLY